jgi:hypothetical protein
MISHLRAEEIVKKEIVFPNGNRALLVNIPTWADPVDVLATLELSRPQALIMIAGAAASLDPTVKPQLTQLFSRGIARAAMEKGATIFDGGTDAGVMALMGQGVADRGRQTPLVGVAPTGQVTYPGQSTMNDSEDAAALEPNHSHFVLVKSEEWGGETETMYCLAKVLVSGNLPPLTATDHFEPEGSEESSGKKVPVVTILAGSHLEGIAKNEVLQSVRSGWRVIVIEGSGPLPDELGRLHREKRRRVERLATRHWNAWYRITRLWPAKTLSIVDPALAEIIEDGQLHFFPRVGDPNELKNLILQQLRRPREESVLALAWQRFARYDANAGRQQRNYRQLRNWPLILGVLTVILALSYTALTSPGWLVEGSWPGLIMRFVIITLPIITSVLLAADMRFKAGSKYILLRASAEAIKREIYRYRILSGLIDSHGTEAVSAEARLALEMENVSRHLMQTDVNEAALTPYEGPIPPTMYGAAARDDGFSPLTAERYINIRVGDQLSFYQLRTNQLEKQLRRFQWWILLFGGAGALLAAVGAELWIPLTTALVTAITSYLGYYQLEQTLRKYNQSETNLANLQAWWVALSAAEKENPENINKLVENTEKILGSELIGWVQEMQNALSSLRQPDVDGQSGTLPGKLG